MEARMTQWAFIMLASLCGALAFFLNESRQEGAEWRQKAELARFHAD